MPRKIQSTILVTTEQGRCLELEFWKVPKDCVVLKNTHTGNDGQWMFQDEYDIKDVEKYVMDVDPHTSQLFPKIGYNIGVSNGGYLGEYKDFKDFKKLVEWYMSDWIVEIFDYNPENKLDVLSMLINNIFLRISEYGDLTLENFEYINKYHTRQINLQKYFEIYIKWLRTRIDYLVTEKYKLQKDQLRKLVNICLDFALKYDDCDDKALDCNRSLMFGESLWLTYASFFENALFRK